MSFPDPKKSLNDLLERKAEQEYLIKWQEALAEEREEKTFGPVATVLVFQLYHDWLAIDTHIVADIVAKCKIHTLPHRIHSFSLGVVNVRGQLCYAVSLAHILEIERSAVKQHPLVYPRTLVLAEGENEWACPVHEVEKVYYFELETLNKQATNITKNRSCFLHGTFSFEGREIGYIDPELLFNCLKRGGK